MGHASQGTGGRRSPMTDRGGEGQAAAGEAAGFGVVGLLILTAGLQIPSEIREARLTTLRA